MTAEYEPCDDDSGDQRGIASGVGEPTGGSPGLDPATTPQQAPEPLEALADAARERRDAASAGSDVAVAGGGADASGPRRRPVAPAEGERNAVVGYLGQYEFAAARTLAALREGALVSVRVADVEAGQIDDFQLRAAHSVDAHQVKWSLHPGTIGFAEFLRDAESRTRYIRQLADGWKRLTALHQPLRVVVHFVTNDVASSASNPSIPRPNANNEQSAATGRTWSFAAFLAEAWRPAVEAARAGQDPVDSVPGDWRPALAALEQASGLPGDAWRRFLADCELEFGAPSLDTLIAGALVTDAERVVLRDDANRLAHAIMQLVARPDRRIEFTREELLRLLGWRDRAEFRHPHEFPDPEIPYRSIVATAREVTEAIERFTGGYLAVVGSPGSGKSTLLTRMLREGSHRVVRYYAYVRGAAVGNRRRGEAVNFLHDLTVALGHAGFRAGATLPADDLDLLTRRVHEQLQQAHCEWRQAGRRTIILVDGLDHIPREQHPTNSLLAHLPDPEEIPDGVLFVLGTQTDRLPQLSSRIRDHLDATGRRISMSPLEREDVLDILEATTDLVRPPSPAERERIFHLSGGHPLALNYIINRLRHSGAATVADTLDAVEPFSESIDRQYVTIWETIEPSVDLAKLLALLARARGSVRLAWVRQWAPAQALHEMTTRLAYLFRQERGGRWTFFHNSFRAFLIEATRGVPALGDDAELFTDLAERSAGADPGAPERADELYFRARAGDTRRVLALADPERFREQFLAGRSPAAVLDDLSLAVDAAFAMRDVVALTRLLLARVEFGQRAYYAELLPLAETWLELGDADRALDALREGATLRPSRSAALGAAVALDARGLSAEARDVFVLAEPFDVLRGTGERSGHPREVVDLLEAWIAAAPRFRPLASVLGLVDGVRVTADDVWHPHDGGEAAIEAKSEELRCTLLSHLARSLDRLARWDEADTVRSRLRNRGDQAQGWWFRAQAVAWPDAIEAGEWARADSRFAELVEAVRAGRISEADLGPVGHLVLANGYLRLAGDPDAARQMLDGVEQPDFVTEGGYARENGWIPFHQRFALNRALGALGDDRPLSEIVPDPAAGTATHMSAEAALLSVRFERGVAQLGRLAGLPWVGRRLAPSDFEAHARRLMRLFPDHPHMVRGGYVVLQARQEFYVRLVQAAAAHGEGCVVVLRALFEAEWTNELRRDAWPDTLVRAVLKELHAVGTPAGWLRPWLVRLEPMAFRGEDLETDLADGVSHVRLWAAVGDAVAARATLDRVLGAAFGNEAKDDQLVASLEWAIRANQDDPVAAPARLAQMAAAVLSLDGAEAQGCVAPKLIEAGVAAGARPARALVEWALRNDVRSWVEALTALVDGLVTRAPTTVSVLSTAYRSLVLPFERGAEVDVVAHVVAGLRSVGAAREFAALAEAVEVVALGSTRAALREVLAGRSDEALELLRDESVTDPTAPGQVVDAFEGLSLTLRELQARVQGVGDVEELARRLKPNAYAYRWELILGPLIARATPDELVAIADAIPMHDYAWQGLAPVAKRLLAVGDQRAGTVIERVIRSSRAAGWWSRYDGGSRLTAYELLVRFSPESGRQAAWEALRTDVAAGEVGSRDLVREWARIAPMLDPAVSAVAIWSVVAPHIAALIAHAPRGEPLVLPAAEDPADPTAAVEAVTGLVATYLDHAAYALAQGAQQFFTDQILAGDSVAIAAIATRLADEGAPKGGALLVLSAAARASGALPDTLHDALRALRRAPSYPDRRSAEGLLHLVDGEGAESVAPPSAIERPLPPTFQLVHPPAVPLSPRPSLPGRGELLPPAAGAADLVGVFRSELDLIARWADVQPEALYAYVADRATAGRAADDLEHPLDEEPALREELRRLGLEVTYRRPRPRRVERAMGEATAMLLDHGRLDTRYHAALDRLFRSADPFFVVARPSRRPAVVAPIPERAVSKYLEKEWTSAVSAGAAAMGQKMSEDDGWVVLAEETWLRWLDWGYPTETRVGARLEPGMWPSTEEKDPLAPGDMDGDIPAGESLAVHVASFSHLRADEYRTRGGAPYSIIVRNHSFRFDTPGGGWLAINPRLAEQLGWRQAPDGLFRWLDSEGQTMVESIWWQDGFAQHRPPLFDDEVGRGWLVRASPQGWRHIAAAVGECLDWRRVQRLAREQPPHGEVAIEPLTEPPATPGTKDALPLG